MRFALLAAFVLLLPACAQLTQPVAPRPRAEAARPMTISAEGPYIQAASGMTFPAAVGGFQRTAISRYRADGSDESAAYSLHNPDGSFVLATVFVYPSPEMPSADSVGDPLARSRRCLVQFLIAHNDVVTTTPNAELVARGELKLAQGTAEYVGPRAAYLSRIGEDADILLGTELHLFCYVGGAWSVKYLFSYPASHDAHDQIRAFMDGLALTIGRQQRDDSLSAALAPDDAPGGAG